MYSRYHNPPSNPIHIPENYSGCAFSRTTDLSDPTPASGARKIDVAKPTPLPPAVEVPASMPPPPRAVLLPPVKDSEKTEREEARVEDPRNEDKTALPTHAVSLPPPIKKLFGNVGNAFPFAHGIGFDELLIIGLIVLLSRSAEDSDLILWLALLLFCG